MMGGLTDRQRKELRGLLYTRCCEEIQTGSLDTAQQAIDMIDGKEKAAQFFAALGAGVCNELTDLSVAEDAE